MSRFAKLVNAQAAREQEPPRQPEVERAPVQAANEKESAPSTTRKSTGVVTPVSTPVVTGVETGVTTPVDSVFNDIPRESGRTSPQYLDATHTASEQRVYSIMYRETVSRGVKERHFGPKELCEKTGIRSDRTIRTALDGLIAKLSVEIASHSNGSPLGPRYRVYEPKEIVGRRKAAGLEIDSQSKKILTPVATPVTTGVATGDKNYRGTGVDFTGVTGVDFTGASYKYINAIGGGGESAAGSSSNPKAGADDEAFAGMVSLLKRAAEEVAGKGTTAAEQESWNEVAELLVTELKIAASRTTVSSAPAFLAEHLRRRLRKADSRQIEREVQEAASGTGAPATPRPELTHEQVQEKANLISSLLKDGAAIEELEEQFAASYRPSQWHMIRSIALAQANIPTAERGGRER